MLDLSVIIVNWNTRDLLADCIRSVQETVHDLRYDIWVVDNASTDDSVAMLRSRFPTVNVIANTENVGFACANNQAMAASSGRYMLLFNSDALATVGAIQALVGLAERTPRAGIVGAHLVNADGTFQASHTRFPNIGQEFMIISGLGRRFNGYWYPSHTAEEASGPVAVDYVEGACLLVRRTAYEAVGGLDEGYFMYAEEVDWCYTMQQQGWQVWYEPAARVIHLGGGSSQNRRTAREADLYRSRVRFFKKYRGPLAVAALKAMIVGFTAIKLATHSLLRSISHGQRRRQVVSVREITTALRKG
ncbi:MAG: glycosyltransferase family 2 protein [Caldilineaceae bacterium]